MKKIYAILAVSALFAVVSCEDKIDPLTGELDFDRVLGTAGFRAEVRNISTLRLTWDLRDGADKYVVEVHEDSLEFNNLVYTSEVLPSDAVPYYQFTLPMAGETVYSTRVKGVSTSGKADSKWSAATVRTPAENIFQPIPVANILVTDVTLGWPAGSEVTHIVLTPGNINRVISAGEKAAGSVTIEELNSNTTYTATLYNNDKRRGVVNFTTLREANVSPEDDLATKILEAAEGAILVLEPGEYTMGAIALTKSITLEGQKPFDRPLIYGNFTSAVTIQSIVLKNLVFNGSGSTGQIFSALAGSNIETLSMVNCEISNYTNSFIASTSTAANAGVFGSINISGSYVHDIPGTGGDGLDFRGGSVGSLTVQNSTFANGFRAFLRMQVSSKTSFRNCTFYKISQLDNSNNTGIFRTGGTAGDNNTLEVRNCLFVETGVSNPTAVQSGNWCRNAGNMVAVPTYASNNIFSCYNLLVGLYTTAAQVSATELDPGFVDAANGNFKITNETLIDNNIGDMSWQ